ncbi:MAG: SDR family NAD(P)-dependent oxidoreductase [Endozoicomonas sp.]
MLLDKKKAIVTGGAKGIGLATSNLLAENGATVFINGRDAGAIDKAVSMISGRGLSAQALPFDVSDPDSVKQGFQAFFKQSKKLDIMVNNAGVLDDALIGMVTQSQIDRTFAINTYGVLYCSQYASRLMTRAGQGSIINLTSIIGTNGNQGQAVYGGSKAAVIGITRSLAKELAVNGIRVNAIAPGFIDTPMARSIPEEKFAERMGSIAMKKIGLPEDVAGTVLYLASDLSTYVTGQVIGVDGGMLI